MRIGLLGGRCAVINRSLKNGSVSILTTTNPSMKQQ
jgi:hypothetical protein